MSTFDRSQLKPTNLAVLKEQEKEIQSKTGTSEKRDYLEIPEGLSKFRIYPAHPGGSTYIKPKVVYWIPQPVQVVDPKDKTKKITEIKRKPFFSAKVHSPYGIDVIEEYVKYVKIKLAATIQDKAILQQKIDTIHHFQTGLMPKTGWVCYAHRCHKDGTKEFGRLELTTSINNALSKLSVTEESDEVIQIDPFTDPDLGKAILITYNPKLDPKDKYVATIEFRGDYRLTDEEIDVFMSQKPLDEIIGSSVYKRSDFENTLKGLQIYDTENKYNAFGDSEWLGIVEKINNLIPKDKPKEENSVAAAPTSSINTSSINTSSVAAKSTVVAAPINRTNSVVVDEFTDLDRDQLIDFIADMELDIKVRSTTTDEEIRVAIREAMSQEVQNQEEIEQQQEVRMPASELDLDSRPTAPSITVENFSVPSDNLLPGEQKEENSVAAAPTSSIPPIGDRLAAFRDRLAAAKK